MTYNNLCQDLATLKKDYNALTRPEKKSEKGLIIQDRIWEIKEQLQEIEHSLKSFCIPHNDNDL
jgi:hypothetical protein